MMASTHTSTSCSPTPLDLPFAYSSYNTEQESSDALTANGDIETHDNNASSSHSRNHDTPGDPTISHNANHRNTSSDLNSNPNENALRFDYNPDYYSSPSHLTSSNQRQGQPPYALESISFVASNNTNNIRDARLTQHHDDGYSGFVTVIEKEQQGAQYNTNSTIPLNHSNYSTNIALQQQTQINIPKSSNPSNETETQNTATNTPATIFMGADCYRYGPDVLSLLLDADSLQHPTQTQTQQHHLIIGNCEAAHQAAKEASKALQNGEFEKALQQYTQSAKAYRDVALSVQHLDSSLFQSLLLLSQAQARSGTSLLALHQANTIQLDRFPLQHKEQDSVCTKSLEPCCNKIQSASSPSSKHCENHGNDNSNTGFGTKTSSSSQTTNPSSSNHTLKSHTSDSFSKSSTNSSSKRSSVLSNQDKIRATIRGALSDNKEADITDSTFLGMAVSSSKPNDHGSTNNANMVVRNKIDDISIHKASSSNGGRLTKSFTSESKDNSIRGKQYVNPVDDLMKLEKELKDMNMTVQLGNSIASLNLSRVNGTSRLKQSSMDDGSFCLVRPGSSSIMMGSRIINPSSSSSSSSLSSQQNRLYTSTNDNFEAGIRARASRLHPFAKNEIIAAKSHLPTPTPSSMTIPSKQNHDDVSLDASWWGNSSIHSSSSSIANSSLNNGSHMAHTAQTFSNPQHILPHPASSSHSNQHHHSSLGSTNTKQVMRLLDSLKTLGDENAALLREVEEARAGRLEAKAAREQMKMFKADYGKKFSRLKAALDKVRKEDNGSDGHKDESLLKSSDYMASRALAEVKKKDQMIQKLAAELRKEREESKKKDVALRKYENFYKEVKLKALQRQKEQEKLARQKKQSKMKHNSKANSAT